MKNYKIEIKWGIIFTLTGLVWMIFEKTMGWHGEKIHLHPIYTNIFGFLAVLIFVLALKDKKKNFYKGVMTWREGFISGIIVTIVVALLSPLSQYVTSEFISPSYFENMIEYSVANNRMNRSDAESLFNLKSYMIQAVSGALIMGVVTSAIVAWFVKTKKEKQDQVKSTV